MVFKPLKKRRKRGEKYPEGFIKRKIACTIAQRFPDGIEEPVLRDTLRDEWGISEPRGIKVHLADLEEKKVLVKEEKKGFPNTWKLNQGYETFKYLTKELGLLTHEDKFEFIKSKYVQSILTDEFLNPQVKKVLGLIKIPQELQELAPVVKLLTPKPEIFRRFPLALYYLLFPEEIEKELSPLRQLFSEKEFSGFWDVFAEQLLTPEGIRSYIEFLDTQIRQMQERKKKLIEMQKKVVKHADNH